MRDLSRRTFVRAAIAAGLSAVGGLAAGKAFHGHSKAVERYKATAPELAADSAGGGPATTATAAPPLPTATPASTIAARIDRNVAYGSGDTAKLDIYYSAANLKPAPLVIYIHGGAFTGGDKFGLGDLPELPEILSRGFAVATINYRLGEASRFPNAVNDAKAAVRFLRANAPAYGLDPKRIGVWGRSAGGYLAAMIGLTAAADGFDVGDNATVSSRVLAVVDQFGFAEFTARNLFVARADFLGPDSASNPDLLRKATALTYVTNDDPPFLVMHGDMDTQVPIIQAQKLVDALTAAGVPAQLVTVQNAGHEFVATGGPISPSLAEIARMVGTFFDEHLK